PRLLRPWHHDGADRREQRPQHDDRTENTHDDAHRDHRRILHDRRRRAETYARTVLIRTAVLERIARGEIDTQFRRQKKPTGKAGGTLRTHVGMLEIVAVDRIELDDVTERDARRSGAKGRDQVIAELTAKPDG